MIKRILLVAIWLCGCTGAAETRARTAIEVLGQAGAGSYALARDQCRREQIAYAAIGGVAQVNTSLARCQTIYDVFEHIGELQRAAVTAVESGELDKAQALLAEVSAAWSEWRGGP